MTDHSGLPSFASDTALRETTLLPEKRRLYADETFFREGWSDVEELYGADAHDFAARFANVMVKPDGIVGRFAEPTLAFLADHDVEVIAAAPVSFDRALARILWQFKQNVATLDRLEVMDRLQTACPSLFLLVRSTVDLDVPLSVKLTSIKGPAKLAARRPGQLRARLGVENRFLNVVHSADEPADHVRELGLLFDRDARRDLLLRARDGGNGLVEARALTAHLHELNPRHDLDYDASLRRLAAATGVASLLDGMPSWATVREAAASAIGPVNPWDVIVVGAHVVEEDVSGIPRLIDSDAQDAWRDMGTAVPSP